jgi:radical SAM protein with 4Fe4S-binding SPASM domain
MIQLSHRIILTELCNRSCEHCFNSNFRRKGMMDVDIFIRYMKENSQYLRGQQLKVMGGEPTLHPRFVDVIDEAFRHFGDIRIFTNGSTMSEISKEPKMIKTHFAGVVKYLINGYTFEPEKFNEYKEFVRKIILHCVIPLDNVDEFINKVLKFTELGSQVSIMISPDTQVDLFDNSIMKKYRHVWLKAVTSLVPRLGGAFSGFDHHFPTCFFTQEMLDILHAHNIDISEKTGCCGEFFIGLIDWNFDLYYCNQTRIKIGNVLDENGNMISLPKILDTFVVKAPQMKFDAIREFSEKCRSCLALSICKVGCYFNICQQENLGRRLDCA